MQSKLIYNVEDDENIRELVKYALQNEGYEVISFETAENMIKALKTKIPELIILDIMLPEMDGIEALKIIRQEYKEINLRIIMLTAKNSEINKISGLDSGADDYITKPFSVLELVARVKANLRKYNVEIKNEVLVFQKLNVYLQSRDVYLDNEKIDLTLKEFELLIVLLKNVNSIVSRDILFNDVWGYDVALETRTLDIHINQLRTKLKEYGKNIITARGVGYGIKEQSV